jgi:hypothetical protein
MKSVVRFTALIKINLYSFKSRQGLGIFLFATASRLALGPTNLLSDGYQGHFLAVKRPGCEADRSPISSAEVKNAWSYTPIPQYAFMASCSVEAQGQIYIYLLP